MELTIKIPLSKDVLQKSSEQKKTVRDYVLENVTFLNMEDQIHQKGPVQFFITENDAPFIQINIDIMGILPVVGGVSYQSSEGKINLLLVDEGVACLLFRLVNKKALFYGGLNGLEFQRFQQNKPGDTFKYYRRIYQKLSMKEIDGMVDKNVIYYYDTPMTVDNPRKKNENKRVGKNRNPVRTSR
jgi:hypothetical protein